MNARFVAVVVWPVGPGVTVLYADESRVILIGFLVIVSNFLDGDA